MARSFAPRSLALGAVALTASVVAASCVDLFDLEGYGGATDNLCETLRLCFGDAFYPECRAFSDPRLSGADAAARSAWLTMFADSGCLETCNAARLCLDEPPVCGETALGCGRDEQCCGFTTGQGTCESNRCCKPDGVACTDNGECCGDDCAAAPGQSDTFCGGYACKRPGEQCSSHPECCTQICLEGTCSNTGCLPAGSECTFNAECCDGECTFGDVVADDGGPVDPVGVCVVPVCGGLGAPCQSSVDCCSGTCVTSIGGESVCSNDVCLPEGIACSPGANECCGSCDDVTKLCTQSCSRPLSPCAEDGDCCDGNCQPASKLCGCYGAGVPCAEHGDCCDKNCINFTCGANNSCPPPGTPCVAGRELCCHGCGVDERTGDEGCCAPSGCAHGVCVQGAPLIPACGCPVCTGGSVTPDRCISEVCELLPHCCCLGWDQECIDAAVDVCGATCAVGEVEVALPQTPVP